MELPLSFVEFNDRKELHAFVEVYVTSKSIEPIENLYAAVARKKKNRDGALMIGISAIEILGASIEVAKVQIRNLNRSGVVSELEETALRDSNFSMYLGATKASTSQIDIQKALKALFRSANIPEQCFEAEVPFTEDKIMLGSDTPNKFRFRVNNYEYYRDQPSTSSP